MPTIPIIVGIGMNLKQPVMQAEVAAFMFAAMAESPLFFY